MIRANLSGRTEKPVKSTVAVAVNGIIRAVSVLQHIETVAFDYQVLVAPGSFKTGNNSIRFYEVNKATGTTSLSPILFESKSRVELINATSNPMSLGFNSLQLPVASTGEHGEIIIIANEKTGQIRLTGWAANSNDGKIATEIFLFSGDKLITSVKPHSRYPKAQEITGFANAEYSGFNLIMPLSDSEKYAQAPFTAIAVFEPDTKLMAGELRYTNWAGHLFKTRKIKLRSETLEEKTDKNVIEPGRVYDFSDDTQALLFSGSGWSLTSSNKARWNAANEVSFSFTANSNELPLKLVVQASPFFVKEKHETQAIEVSFPSSTSQLITLQRGETDGRFVIHIATEDINADGAVMVKLKFLNAASPKSIGLNNDTRLLAINVKTLQVLIAED